MKPTLRGRFLLDRYQPQADTQTDYEEKVTTQAVCARPLENKAKLTWIEGIHSMVVLVGGSGLLVAGFVISVAMGVLLGLFRIGDIYHKAS